MNQLKPWLLAALMIVGLSMSQSCSGILLHHAMDKQDAALSPEQILAYEKVGSKAFSCSQLGGPPPIGSLVFITVPKDAVVNVKFGPGCVILMQ